MRHIPALRRLQFQTLFFFPKQVDIENFLSHHPDHRLPRIKELAVALSEKKILPPSAVQDADRLDARWRDLSQKAKLRTTILEGQPLAESFLCFFN